MDVIVLYFNKIRSEARVPKQSVISEAPIVFSFNPKEI